MKRWITWLALIAASLACTAAALGQIVFRSPDHWSITLPDDWEADTAERLAAFNQAAAELGASMHTTPSVRYVALLMPKKPDGRYILLQTQPPIPAGARLSDLQQVIDEATRTAERTLRESAALETSLAPTLDRERARVITTGRVAVPGQDPSGLVSITNFGKSGNVLVHAYAPEPDFPAAKPALLAVADTFAFDNGHAYEFRPDGINWNRVFITAAVCGIAGAVFGGIMQRFKPKPA